jgi:hypothetical protein
MACKKNMGSDLIALKLSEIIYTQVMRTYLASEAAKEQGLEKHGLFEFRAKLSKEYK